MLEASWGEPEGNSCCITWKFHGAQWIEFKHVNRASAFLTSLLCPSQYLIYSSIMLEMLCNNYAFGNFSKIPRTILSMILRLLPMFDYTELHPWSWVRVALFTYVYQLSVSYINYMYTIVLPMYTIVYGFNYLWLCIQLQPAIRF